MTKKDYILIADSIAESYINVFEIKDNSKLSNFLYELTENLSTKLLADNPNFDGIRFVAYINKKISQE